MERRNLFHEHASLIQRLASIGSKKVSGILILQKDQQTRKLLFSQGDCIAVTSTIVRELPGSFLYHEGIITKNAYDIYLLKAMEANVRQWDLAIESKSITEAELQEWKYKHALFVVQNISTDTPDNISFEPKQFPSTVPIIASNLDFITHVAHNMSLDDIYAIAPALQNEETTITVTELFPKDVVQTSIKGLYTILCQHKTLQDIFTNSLLDRQKILSYLLSFSLMEWVTIESATQYITKTFVENLSIENHMLREEIINHWKNALGSNYYQCFSLSPTSNHAQIERQYLQLKQKLQKIDDIELFSKTEDNITQKLKLLIEEAYSVLSNSQKRVEYDQYLKQGKAQSFFETSQSIAHEKAQDHFNQLRMGHQGTEAAEFGLRYLEENSQSIQFSIQYVEFILTSQFIKEQKYQNICFDLVKYHIENHPNRYEPFFLLGKLCTLLKQEQNALKSFQRALETRPDIPSLREYIIDKLPNQGPEIVLYAIYEKMDQLNYYQLLAVDPKSSPKEVHDAFRMCCKYFHPDRFFNGPSKEEHKIANQVFKKISQSYKTLKNFQARKKYDEDMLILPEERADISKKNPPTHFKAKEYYNLAALQIKEKNYEGALVNLQFSLQLEPENTFLQEKIEEVKTLKKAH